MKTAVRGVASETTTCTLDPRHVLRLGRNVLHREEKSIAEAAARLGESFVEAVRAILNCPGRVAVTGMGKAGDIGKKIQATLSSTATPAYCLHPVEALHGDLGMIQAQDIVIALSKSGETQELVSLLPALRGIGCAIILVTADPESKCARLADVVLDIGNTPEACPLGLAPSSSTAAMLAMGDALALTVMELKNVQPEQYASYHPGGALGRHLAKVSEVMRTGSDCPTVELEGTLSDYYEAVMRAPRRAGAAAIIDDTGKLIGIFTHGDLFRLRPGMIDPQRTSIARIMTSDPKTARQTDRVAAALHTMQRYRIDELPVVDEHGKLAGLIDIQDLVARGYSAFDDQ
ncbi:MAG: KpsF/GutQ family sugar-phosphate isomerase [Phycisphaerae bacterium]|nr:KpsF/GutQ family sugar-phosphate isomerase [Phycisphaerae bacterium]